MAAALLQNTRSIQRKIMTSVSNKARGRHCHTQRTEEGMMWGNRIAPGPDRMNAETRHPSPVLCSASALAQYKGYKGDEIEVISPKGSYRDRCTK